MSNLRSIQGSSEKAFYDVFQQLCVRHSPWTIWCDFIKLFACSLSNALEPDMARREDREKMYLSTASGYPADELKQFAELASITILAHDQNPQQDFLGNLYMSMDFGSSWHGQFFTPWHIASCMAKMTISDCEGELQDKGFVSVNDPTCGAGCMLLAAADAYRYGKLGQERNYQTDILFVGQDLDPVVALMCYIQLSLMGCAGYVAIGNTLSNPVCGHVLDPVIGESGELWFTPMWYSPLWQYRREMFRICTSEGVAG